MPKAFRGRIAMFEYQPPAVINQAAPVQNTWYTLLEATDYVRVYQVAANIEDTNETLEVEVVIDGETLPGVPFAATHSTVYYAYVDPDAINRVDGVGLNTPHTGIYRAFMIEGHNVRIRVRKTTAAGVGNLTAIAIWGVLTDVP